MSEGSGSLGFKQRPGTGGGRLVVEQTSVSDPTWGPGAPDRPNP